LRRLKIAEEDYIKILENRESMGDEACEKLAITEALQVKVRIELSAEEEERPKLKNAEDRLKRISASISSKTAEAR
jgi:hypothetical protein